MRKQIKSMKFRNAVFIGALCSMSYLSVYFARNVLSAAAPQMIMNEGYTEEYIGSVSSAFFAFYAVGQLVNGAIGDRIKAQYMLSFGLVLAGVCNLLFSNMHKYPYGALLCYGMAAFFLSMIYGPMIKVTAENTESAYATRCSVSYSFAAFLGTPIAGLTAAIFFWKKVFALSSVLLILMGVICFLTFLYFEKKEIVKYDRNYIASEQKNGGIKMLIQNKIIKFTMIAIVTGVVRTAVVFWLPTYISQYLGFSAETSTVLFAVSTFIIALSPFIAVFTYEKLGENMDLTLLIMFLLAAASFLLVSMIKQPFFNIVFMIIAIMSSNCSSDMIWSRYCPGLRDTGMVSSVTGFLDFVSYVAAAVSNLIFANAVAVIGWEKMILVWFGLMLAGVFFANMNKK